MARAGDSVTEGDRAREQAVQAADGGDAAADRALTGELRSRREKLAAWRERGVDPFGARYEPTHRSAGVIAAASGRSREELDRERTRVRLAGRLIARRGHGRAGFAHILDAEGTIQIYARADALGDSRYEAFELLDIGDIVGVEGFVFRTNRGEATVHLEDFSLLG